MRRYRLCIVALIAVLAATGAAWGERAALTPASKIVSAKAYLSVDKLRPSDKFRLAVRATVKDGYHIGAHDKDALYPAKLTIAATKGIAFAAPVYPKAVRKSFSARTEKLPVYEGTFTIFADGRVDRKAKPGRVTINAKLETQACKVEQCFPPESLQLAVKTDIAKPGAPVKKINPAIFDSTTGGGSDLQSRLARAPLALQLLMLYGLGLLLAFTPCVYPMVPVTVGYFSTQGHRRTGKVVLLAGTYVLGLALTYSILGAVAATAGGVFGAATQSPPVLVGIAVVLVALALSMFGLYELQAPAFIQSRASGKSGVAGALVMGLIFGVVAAPCVGPVVLGLMAYVASLGSPLMGFVLFFALSLGLGTPLFALAAFSAKLPVPGMWMVAVKKAAGFLLLGAAAYFLIPILPDSIARYAVPVVLVAGGLYLAFFEKSIRASRVGASLGRATGMAALIVGVALAVPKPANHALAWQPYSPSAVAAAARSGKPVVIDFTAKWCVVCKELQDGPFRDPTVVRAMGRFELFRVDGTNRADAAVQTAERKFDVKGYPAVIFIDRSGNEVSSARIAGYVDSQEMLKRIDAAD